MQPLLENTRRHDITFHRNGRIRITARIVRILRLRPGDSINIALSDGEYLLFAVRHNVGRHQARCHPSKRGGRNFCANSIRLCRLFFEALGIQSDRVSFMAGEPTERLGTTYLPIITSAPLFVSLCEPKARNIENQC